MSDDYQVRKDIDRLITFLNNLEDNLRYEFNTDLNGFNDVLNDLNNRFYDKSETYTNAEIDEKLKEIYPVGSIYLSVNDVDPSTLFGGTWERIEDRFLLASGEKYPVGEMKGEAEHTLTTSEMPSHTHIQNAHNHTQAQHRHKEQNNYSNGSGSASAYTYTSNRTAVAHYTDYQTPTINNATATNQNTGGSQAHNNMPPYLVVNVWQRIK